MPKERYHKTLNRHRQKKHERYGVLTSHQNVRITRKCQSFPHTTPAHKTHDFVFWPADAGRAVRIKLTQYLWLANGTVQHSPKNGF